MEKILISSCFLGEPVRYNGIVKTFAHDLITTWQQQGRLVAICPEVIGGLPTPRPPAEIQQNTQEVITINGENVSDQFTKGSQVALQICQRFNIRFALLKEGSPSCGSQEIYDGSFSKRKIPGQGTTTRLLEQHGILVFSEHQIDLLAQKLI